LGQKSIVDVEEGFCWQGEEANTIVGVADIHGNCAVLE
jgi:hypothetical protein